MKRRLMTVMAFAVVAALAASTVLYKIVTASSAHAANGSTMRVFVAARDLAPGVLITDTDLRTVDWPEAAASQWMRKREDIVGRGLLEPIHKDEPFAESRLAQRGAGSGIATRIPPGFRAVAVHVDELTGMSRFIFSGTHVDVISTGGTGGPGSAGTRTILQNVEVLSTGDRDGKEKFAAPQSVNLLVTPQQAEILSQAVAQGRIDLVLRNPLDTGNFISSLVPSNPAPQAAKKPAKKAVDKAAEETTPKVTPAPAAAPAPPPPPPPSVEIIHGNKKEIMVVGSSGQGSAQ